jgi:hypothetical protein
MKVSRSGYYVWKNSGKSRHREENENLLPIGARLVDGDTRG